MDNADVDKRTDRTSNARFLTELMLALVARGLEVELNEFSTYDEGDSFTATLRVELGAPGINPVFFDFAAGDTETQDKYATLDFYQIRVSASPTAVADTPEDRARERRADEYLVEEIELAMGHSANGLLSAEQVAEVVAGAMDAADFAG